MKTGIVVGLVLAGLGLLIGAIPGVAAEFGCFVCRGSNQLRFCAWPSDEFGREWCESVIGQTLPPSGSCSTWGNVCYGIAVDGGGGGGNGGGGGAGSGCFTGIGGFCPASCFSCIWVY